MNRTMLAALATAAVLPVSAFTAAPATAGSRVWLATFPHDATSGTSGSATSIAVSASRVFVTGTLSNGRDSTVAYDGATGARQWTAAFRRNPHLQLPLGAPLVAASPDGSAVYVDDSSTRNDYKGNTTVRAYNGATGAQLWLGQAECGCHGPQSMMVSPDGSQVFVQSNSGHNYPVGLVIAFSAATGQEQWLARAAVPGRGQGSSMAVSPDGAEVFLSGHSGTAAFDASTGAQLWVAHYKIHWGRYPDYLAVSPGSSTVYVTGGTGEGKKPHYLTTAYNATTGAQLWVASYYGGQLTGVAASPGGAAVYVTGHGPQGGFETIAYNASTGARLWAAAALANGTATSVAVSPDGSLVYVNGATLGPGNLDEYATIAYDATTGAKRWAGAYQGQPGSSASPSALGVNASGVFVTGTTAFPSGKTKFATVAYSQTPGARS